MSTSSRNYQTRMECYYGYDVCVQRRWTVLNQGRRVLACPDYDVYNNTRSCNLFRWVDKPLIECHKEVILHLMDGRTGLQRDVESFKRKLDFANKKIRKTTSNRVIMKPLYPQRVWRCRLLFNSFLVVIIV